MDIQNITKRRTFGIISHPDAVWLSIQL